MSIIFGVKCEEGSTPDEQDLLCVASATQKYAPDGTFIRRRGSVGMGYQAFHTHERSQMESQPYIDIEGNMAVFDGRMDNYQALANELGQPLDTTDSSLMLLAFLRWGEDCFSRFVGDWALALWFQQEHKLYLARDHAGSRSLFFHSSCGRVRWATYLDSFFSNGATYDLDDTYAASYLSCQPIRDLTPYKGIRAVRPAHYLVCHNGAISQRPHWTWMPRQKLEYKTDREYEEKFFSLFRQSVERRTGRGAPIVAHLSGGMDSTSIVCMSDFARSSSKDRTETLLDTLSYYDDSESTWNEKPYFLATETQRGKAGIHIRTSSFQRTLTPPISAYRLPGADGTTHVRENQLHEYLQHGSYRALISGIGGDEVLGGSPDPLPELADHLFALRIGTYARQTLNWCLASRKPFIGLSLATLRFLASAYPNPKLYVYQVPPWITPRLYKLQRSAARESITNVSTVGVPPSAIVNGLTWWSILESLPHLFPTFTERYEYRYPYLDKDLVSFLFRLPPDQLLRPGRRRSLMRRALSSIVPSLVLERKRKAYLSHGPLVFLRDHEATVMELIDNSQLVQRGFIDGPQFRSSLLSTVNDLTPNLLTPLMRAVQLELWMNRN